MPEALSGTAGRTSRRTLRLSVLAASAALLMVLFLSLGTWQVKRLAWKQDLIARVDARIHAPAVPAPAFAEWPKVHAPSHEYQRIWLQGHYLHDKEALVQASTSQGAGFWVFTPLQQDDGRVVMVNRGFVPPEARHPSQRGASAPEGLVRVDGLLRISQPKGGFLRTNDPAADKWYSRDVQAIAAARQLPAEKVAPYFVDADAPPQQASNTWPMGGLTVVQFPNSHAVYAITWYALALMVLLAAIYVWRQDRKPDSEDNDDESGGTP